MEEEELGPLGGVGDIRIRVCDLGEEGVGEEGVGKDCKGEGEN